MLSRKTSVAAALLGLALVAGLSSAVPTSAASSTATSSAAAATAPNDDNPFVGRPWGVYKGNGDQAWPPYVSATGNRKKILGEIALRPKAKWFGKWIHKKRIKRTVRGYIENAQAGDPTALVQMTVFAVKPWNRDACARLPTKAEKRDYKQWIRRFASAVKDTPTVIILQPDGPFALCAPNGSKVPSRLVKYAAKRFARLPNTDVYIDAGAHDWPAPGQGGAERTLEFLIPGGIKFARGVALNSTHYSATELEIQRAAELADALAARGMPGKKAVINTSSSGKPFPFGQYDGRDSDNARVCRSKTDQRLCVTLGIPPTADVTNPAWGLSDEFNALAAEHVDAYLWFGRPWLYRQADPFKMGRAVKLVKSWPFRRNNAGY